MAADGRYVGFISEATNLVPSESNLNTDVFVHDLQSGSTVLTSISSTGTQGNAGTDRVTLSADGRYVAMRSKADNLVTGDLPSYDVDLCPLCTGVRDVFVHDRDPDGNGVYDESNGVTMRVSVSSAGVSGDLETGGPKLSGDGAIVAMVGRASNMVPGDTNNTDDVFARTLSTSVTERINVSSAGTQASTPPAFPPDNDDAALSGDGRFVAFRSFGINLVSLDTNLEADVFLHDRDTDSDGIFGEPGTIETRRVSVSSAGAQGNRQSGGAKISADGRLVAFYSDARNLVPGDTNDSRDVFLHGEAAASVCGNSVVEPGEACDDGNIEPGDGCDSKCLIETAIPTVSEWGVLAMALLIVLAGTIIVRERRNFLV